jgi:beta-glucosidase
MSIATGGRGRLRVGVVLIVCVVAAALAATAFAGTGRSGQARASGAPVYKEPRQAVRARVRDLLGRMTLEEKVGQMGQVNSWVLLGDPATPWDWPADFNLGIVDDVFGKDKIGSVLSGGGAWPPPPQYANDARGWAEFTNRIQAFALDPARNRLGIPNIYGADAVHGHNNLSDATDFPHQIGLGAAFDPALVGRLGRTTGRDVRATGVQWSFSPVMDTERDLRWGRSYEPYGEDPFLNGRLGSRFIRGAQGRRLSGRGSVAATAKHFTGYSAPDSGHDRTDATIGQSELQDIHIPAFRRAIDAGAATVMVNSGSVNGEPVHASHHLLTDVLRGQLGFKGVAISDWNDVENLVVKYHVADNMEDAIALAFNAGVDMSMIPLVPDNKYDARPNFGYFENAVAAVRDGKVPMRRIDQAVSRILTLKFRLGLFEHPYVDPAAANRIVEDPSHRPLARRAARESLVLLENHGALPLSRRTHRILVTGPSSDSPTNQLGGWSVAWQGAFNLPAGIGIPPVTTIREGVERAAGSGTQVTWKQGVPVGDTTNRTVLPAQPPVPPNPVNDPDDPAVAAARSDAVQAAGGADAIVVAVGESPYAEGEGDDDTPELPPSQARLIDELEATGKPVIVVVVAGRPLVMNRQLDRADAALMAFLPGSEGGAAIADALFGRYNPGGRLTVSWPRSTSQLPLAYNEPGPYHPRYPFGYGLSYSRFAAGPRAPRSVGRSGRVRLSVALRNRGRRAGDHVVLAFATGAGGPARAAPRRLVAFRREHLRAGGRERVGLSFDVSQLAFTPPGARRPRIEPGRYWFSVDGARKTFRVR